MNISSEQREQIKRAIVSIFIGAVVAFITTLIEGLLGILKESLFNYVGVPVSLIYFLRKRIII